MKKCSYCQKIKPLDNFHKNRIRPDGHHTECKECKHTIDKISRNKHLAKRKAQKKQYRIKNPKQHMLSNARGRAKRCGFEYNLDQDSFEIPSVCPILGIEIKLDNNNIDYDSSPSLDRIDNNKGYIKGNVQVVSMRANRLKADATAEELRAILKWMEVNGTNYGQL